MLKLRYVMLFLLLISMAACGNKSDQIDQKKESEMVDKRKIITRKWKIDVNALRAEMKIDLEKQKKENPENIEDAQKLMEKTIDMMGNYVMSFKENGTLEVGNGERNEKRKWELSEDKTYIITKDEKNKEQKLKIKSISSSKLELEPDENAKKRGTPNTILIPA